MNNKFIKFINISLHNPLRILKICLFAKIFVILFTYKKIMVKHFGFNLTNIYDFSIVSMPCSILTPIILYHIFRDKNLSVFKSITFSIVFSLFGFFIKTLFVIYESKNMADIYSITLLLSLTGYICNSENFSDMLTGQMRSSNVSYVREPIRITGSVSSSYTPSGVQSGANVSSSGNNLGSGGNGGTSGHVDRENSPNTESNPGSYGNSLGPDSPYNSFEHIKDPYLKEQANILKEKIAEHRIKAQVETQTVPENLPDNGGYYDGPSDDELRREQSSMYANDNTDNDTDTYPLFDPSQKKS